MRILDLIEKRVMGPSVLRNNPAPVPVYVNPGHAEMRAIMMSNDYGRGRAILTDRTVNGKKQNVLFAWDASIAIHYQMADALKDSGMMDPTGWMIAIVFSYEQFADDDFSNWVGELNRTNAIYWMASGHEKELDQNPLWVRACSAR